MGNDHHVFHHRRVKLTIKQTIAIDHLEDDQTRQVLFGGGAGGGKSLLGCYWQLKQRLKYPGTRGLIGRSKLKTLKETTLNSFFEVCQMQGLVAGQDYVYNPTMSIIKFDNGSEIILKDLFLYPSDRNFDELGSLEITDAFVDECNQIVLKAWNIVRSRIRYKLDEHGLVPKILGCCNPAKNWTYSDFYKPATDGTLDDKKRFIQSLVTDNLHISEHYIENLKSLDPVSQQRLLHGSWEYDNDKNALMDFGSITDIFSNKHVTEGDAYITGDVARFGSDKTVIVVWSGMRVTKLVTLAQSSMVEVHDLVDRLAKEHSVARSRIAIDDDGVGGGVVDMLGCIGFVNNSRPVDKENFNNLKSQCYFHLAELVNRKGLYIVDQTHREDIIEELEQVKQKDMDKDGKKMVVPKDQVKELIGRSPDFADALMMRMYFELEPSGEYAIY